MALNCPDIEPDLPEGCADFNWFEAHIYAHLDSIVDKINIHLTAEGVANVSYITRPDQGGCASKNETDRIATFLDNLFATGRLPKYAWDAGNPGNPFPDPVNAADVQAWVDCNAYWADLQEVRDCIQDGNSTILPEAACLTLPPANVYHRILLCLANGTCYPSCQCPECVSDQDCWRLQECYDVGQIVVSDDLTVPAANNKIIKFQGVCYEIIGPTQCVLPVFDMANNGGFQEFADCIDCFGCWLLTECYNPTNRIYVTDNLKVQFAAGTVIEYDDDGDGNTTCWEISAPWQCTGSEITMGVWIEHNNCDACIGNLEAEECRTVYRYDDPTHDATVRSVYEYASPPAHLQNAKTVYEYASPPAHSQSVVRSYEYVPATYSAVSNPTGDVLSWRYAAALTEMPQASFSWKYEPIQTEMFIAP